MIGGLNRCNWVPSEFHPHFHIDISQISHRHLRCIVHKTRVAASHLPHLHNPSRLRSSAQSVAHDPHSTQSGASWPPLLFPSLLPLTSHSNPRLLFSASEFSSESSLCSQHHHLGSEPLRRLLRGESASRGTGSLGAKASPLPV